MKEKIITIEYEYRFSRPRFEHAKRIISIAGSHWGAKRIEKYKILKVNVIETQEERSMELTFDLSKYKHSKTVHIEPKKGETAQEFFERFFPVARMEYEQRRQKHMKVALSLASQEFNDKKEETGPEKR